MLLAILGIGLVTLGTIGCIVGGIWLLVLAFQENILWGVGTLLFAPVGLVFAIMNWSKAYKPLLIQVASLVVISMGAIPIAISGAMALSSHEPMSPSAATSSYKPKGNSSGSTTGGGIEVPASSGVEEMPGTVDKPTEPENDKSTEPEKN